MLECCILVIVNNSVMNTGTHVSFPITVFSSFQFSHSVMSHCKFSSDKYPGVKLLDHMLVLFLIFLRNLHAVFGEGNGTPLQYSCLENPMGGGAWKAAVHGIAKSRTRLSDFTFTFHFHALEKEMAAHSSVLAWRIPGTGEPGGLPFLGSHRVGHD